MQTVLLIQMNIFIQITNTKSVGASGTCRILSQFRDVSGASDIMERKYRALA